jgi:hypothetical protein
MPAPARSKETRVNLRDKVRRSKLYYMLGDPIYRLKGAIFDFRYGVQTAPEIPLRNLAIDSPNAALGVKYAATEPRYFNLILDEWGLDYSKFTFIDFGAGMGRVLLMASERPFRKIIGVEFARELITIAENNLRSYSPRRRQCHDVELVAADATDFNPPVEPSIFYFFNPFDRKIFVKVIANLERSLRHHPREAYVLYANPEHNDIFLNSDVFEPYSSGPWHAVHRAKTDTLAK